eukprot:CAMPEP_0197852168 /NCGR_PEP_ID=MMETSP1438-20131217/19815_1 /TAXON_ID=1461541 /ORGANISM="Pterosperma sp., Strain CCMP1384" /LENGTH=319 /DNA_ID=CAMNT_0043466059 /DNA_START=145 /DNA_END=1104 /DNA_ORIENTATION=-
MEASTGTTASSPDVQALDGAEKDALHNLLVANGEESLEARLVENGISVQSLVHTGVAQTLHNLDHPKINDVEYVSEDSPIFDQKPGLDFWTGFIRSYLVIVVIEVGDRTFFIAALMAIKHNQLTVFLGAFTALAIMTVVSTVLGVAAPLLLPRAVTHYVATILFTFFGCNMLYKAYGMEDGVSDELEEVEEELEAKGKDGEEDGVWWKKFLDPVFVQALTMTAIAEWGDRSQIATIAMAADLNPYGISVGGSLGHGCATAGAVLGGRLIASKISERTITIMGGLVFLVFGVMAFFEDPDEDMGNSIPSWMTVAAESQKV